MTDKKTMDVEEEIEQSTVRVMTVLVYVIWNLIIHITFWNYNDSWVVLYYNNNQWWSLVGIHYLHFFAVVLYIIATYSNPGYVDPNHPKMKTITDNNDAKNGVYCKACDIIRPINAKHCYQCKHCIIKYDHHCVFVSNCVGGYNHRFFMIFLLAQIMLLSWGWMCTHDMIFHGKYFKYSNIFSRLFIYFMLFSFVAVLILMGILFICHVILIITGYSTYHALSKLNICVKKKKETNINMTKYSNNMFSNIWLTFTAKIPESWIIPSKIKLESTNNITSDNIDTTQDKSSLKQRLKAMNLKLDDTKGVGCLIPN